METYTKDVFDAIKELSHATQSNIMRKLDKKYGYHATMFWSDAISELEMSGKVFRMSAGGVTTWETD
jgi:hypothetical protein